MLNKLDCLVCPDLANECKSLLQEWRGRNLTVDFDIALCEISCKNKECISDFRWHAEPIPANEFTKYMSLSFEDRAIYRKDHPLFFVRGKTYEYLNERDCIKTLNKRNLDVLKSWVKLEGISPDARLSVEKYINTYSGRME